MWNFKLPCDHMNIFYVTREVNLWGYRETFFRMACDLRIETISKIEQARIPY